MDFLWRPSLEPWGLGRYFMFRATFATDMDLGPVIMGRVYGTEVLAVANALQRVLADAVTATLPGADAALKTDSPHCQGTLVRDKLAVKITTPVPGGLEVIQAGADLAGHETLLHEGRRISPGDLAALAMAGVRELTVFRRPLVAVCVLHKYYLAEQALDQPGANGMPDALSPMVLALLARRGVTVDTIRHLDFDGSVIAKTTTHEINTMSDAHDLTIVLGFLGSEMEMENISCLARMPAFEALSGVGAFPVEPGNKFGFAAPVNGRGFAKGARALLERPLNGMSGRHGVRWLTGILAAPAPRDPERHWIRLARIERDASGLMALRVLPSEEHQISGLIGAEAMVGIAKGDGELAAGTPVEYFLLD